MGAKGSTLVGAGAGSPQCADYYGYGQTLAKPLYANTSPNTLPFTPGLPVAFQTVIGTYNAYLGVTLDSGVWMLKAQVNTLPDAYHFTFEMRDKPSTALYNQQLYALRLVRAPDGTNVDTPYVGIIDRQKEGGIHLACIGASIDDEYTAAVGLVESATDASSVFLLAFGKVFYPSAPQNNFVSAKQWTSASGLNCNDFPPEKRGLCTQIINNSWSAVTFDRSSELAAVKGNVTIDSTTHQGTAIPTSQDGSCLFVRGIEFCTAQMFKMILRTTTKPDFLCNASLTRACGVTPCAGNADSCRVFESPSGFVSCRDTDWYAQNVCVNKKDFTSCESIAGVVPQLCNGYFATVQPRVADATVSQTCQSYRNSDDDRKQKMDGWMNSFCVGENASRAECSCIKASEGNFKPASLTFCGQQKNAPCTFTEFQQRFESVYGTQASLLFFTQGKSCWWPPCSNATNSAYVPKDTTCKITGLQTCINTLTSNIQDSTGAVTDIANKCQSVNVYVDPDTGAIKESKCTGSACLWGCNANGVAERLVWGTVAKQEDVKCAKCDNGVCKSTGSSDGLQGTFRDVAACQSAGTCAPSTAPKYGCGADNQPVVSATGTATTAAGVKCYGCNTSSQRCVALPNSNGNGQFSSMDECLQSSCQPQTSKPPQNNTVRNVVIGVVVAVIVIIIVAVIASLASKKRK